MTQVERPAGLAWSFAVWMGKARQGGAWLGEAGQGKGTNGPQLLHKGRKMKRYDVVLTGASPLLMHHDNIEFADAIEEWLAKPANKKASKPGDDRTPAWKWKGCIYSDGENLCIPSEVVLACLRDGGTKIGTGKRQETFKRLVASGLLIENPFCTFTVGGRQIPVSAIDAMADDAPFAEHAAAAHKLGFRLFLKRAKIGNAKHVRVRPRFDRWELSFQLMVTDPQITLEKLGMILEESGRIVGMCDWRPGSPKSPGPFGRFTAEVSECKR